jgi:hypothetical protein
MEDTDLIAQLQALTTGHLARFLHDRPHTGLPEVYSRTPAVRRLVRARLHALEAQAQGGRTATLCYWLGRAYETYAMVYLVHHDRQTALGKALFYLEHSFALDPRAGETKLALARLLTGYPPIQDRERAVQLLEAWQTAGAFPDTALSLLEKVRKLQARTAHRTKGTTAPRRRRRSSTRPQAAAEAALDASP